MKVVWLDDSSEQEGQQPEVHCVVCLACVLVPSLVGESDDDLESSGVKIGRGIKQVSPRKRRKNEKARERYGVSRRQAQYEERIFDLEVTPLSCCCTHLPYVVLEVVTDRCPTDGKQATQTTCKIPGTSPARPPPMCGDSYAE